MIRKKKLYLRPKKPFQLTRIKEEDALVKRYALKNKREIWKTIAKVTYFRHRAKELSKMPIEEQEVLFNKLKAIGLNTNTIADVLDLKVENLLDRRLTSVLAQKKIANTVRHARQLVTHKKVLIDGKAVSSPSYLVKVAEENKIKIKNKVRKPKAETLKEEAPAQEVQSEHPREENKN